MGVFLKEIIAITEKVTYGKEIDSGDIDNLAKTVMIKSGMKDESDSIEETEEEKISINSKGALSSRDERTIEDLDKNKLKLIIESNNIVEEYNEYLNLEFDKLDKRKTNLSGFDYNIKLGIESLRELGVKENDIRKVVLDTFFEVSDDPKVIKKFLQLRINYNTKIVNLLQKMLRNNYQILGISNEEAEKLNKNLKDDKSSAKSIIEIKQLILNNKSKFIKSGKVDLRELGFGVAYITQKDLREITEFVTLDKLIQILMRYDCMVIGHGSGINGESAGKYNNLSNTRNTIEDKHNDLVTKYNDLYDEYKKEKQKNPDFGKTERGKMILSKIKDLDSKSDRTSALLNNNVDHLKDVINNAKYTWGIQPISTEHGGTFDDMNSLVRELIKEGNKSIYIMSCNPGHYQLDPELRNVKGVHIRMSINNMLSEDFIDYDYQIENEYIEITNTEIKLLEFCKSNDIDYDNQSALEESYFYIMDNQEYLEEGVIGDIWNGLVKLVKKILQALVYLFKNAIAFVRAMFNKIRQFFTGVSNPDAEFHNNKVSFISLESAQVKEINVNNYNQLKTTIMKSCISINREIDHLSQKQTMITKQTQSYIEKKGREKMEEMVDLSILKPYKEIIEESASTFKIITLINLTICKSVLSKFRLKEKSHLFISDTKLKNIYTRYDELEEDTSSLCTLDTLAKTIKSFCLSKSQINVDATKCRVTIKADPSKEYYVYAVTHHGNQPIHDFTLRELEKSNHYKVEVVKSLKESVAAINSGENNEHNKKYGDEIITNDDEDEKDKEDREEDENVIQEVLRIIRERNKKNKEFYQEATDDNNASTKLTKSYSDTYLYSLVSDNYNKQLMQFIRTAHEVDKKDDSFKDIEYDVKRRQTSNAILNILQSDNIILMISENNLPLPKTFKVITATDIRTGEIKKKKVFIDVTGIIYNNDGVYKCNSRNVDILLSYLVNGAAQFIYYADPKRIIMDRNMINEGAWCFSVLFTYVIDYLVKISVNGNMRNQIMYISSVYYLKTILNKDLTDSHFKLCKDISGLSDREIELLGIKFEEENYTNIKTFIHGISELCINEKITLDVIVNKWIYLYGQGTQFALELFPAFANMITNAYNGQFLNNQSAIEKQCGTHMVTFSKGILNLIESATK